MGEIADMMINGLMCEGCGEFMDDHEEPGYPRRCSACSPRKPTKPQEIMRSGRSKKARPFRYSIGSKVLHAVNPATGKSWCQFESNTVRGNSVAFGGPPPIVEVGAREDEPSKRECKGCASLSAKVQP